MSGRHASRPLRWRHRLLRGTLIALVMALMAVLVLLPLAAVFIEALSKGAAAFMAVLRSAARSLF